MIKRLYAWVEHWAQTPYGIWALFLLAFAESSFFPIPPDVLLIAMAVTHPKAGLKFAAICTLGSLLGGAVGYLIGWQFMAVIGESIVNFYGLSDKVAHIEELYRQYDAWAIGIAGFTPIPYKVFTISAGVFKVDFGVFLLASVVGRAGRFFLVGGLIYLFGKPIQAFIDRYLNLLVIGFTVLLIGGFILIKYLI